MKKKLLLFFAALFLFCYAGKTQTRFGKIKDIQVELGASAVFANKTNFDRMRTEPFDYSYYAYDANSSSLAMFHAGVKPEFTLSRRFSFLAGVRFTVTQVALSAKNDYFYWLYNQNGTNTSFAQIRKINQLTCFAGIPLELRFRLVQARKRHFETYVKLGASIDFRLANSTQLHFVNGNMKQYDDEIAGQVGKPSTPISIIQGGFGMKFGNPKKTSASIEFIIPIVVAQSFGIMNTNPGGGIGIQFNLLIPHK